MVNREPFPGIDWTEIDPCIPSTRVLQSESPKPTPSTCDLSASSRSKGMNSLCWISSGIPIPVSST